MHSYKAFLKKELCEAVRTYRLLIVFLLLFILGAMSPLAARYLPELLQSFMPSGMTIALGEPTAADAWAQFYKNVSQIGLIVLVLTFSSMISGELEKGTLIPLLTKGLSRRAVLLSKYTAAAVLWSGAYLISFLAALFYSLYFWKVPSAHLLPGILSLWFFGLLLLTAVLLGGVLFKNTIGALLFTGGFVLLLFLLNLLPFLKDYNPLLLLASGDSLIAGKTSLSSLVKPFLTSAVLGTAALICSDRIFQTRV